jgi:hypothetical protein
MVSGGKIH